MGFESSLIGKEHFGPDRRQADPSGFPIVGQETLLAEFRKKYEIHFAVMVVCGMSTSADPVDAYLNADQLRTLADILRFTLELNTHSGVEWIDQPLTQPDLDLVRHAERWVRSAPPGDTRTVLYQSVS